MRELINLVEAYESKFNPGDTNKGRRIAHHEVGKHVRRLLSEGKVDVNRLSFKSLWEQLVLSQDLEENLVSSAFPIISGEIISSVIIAAYQAFPKNGDRLVRTVPSRLKTSQIAGWRAIGRIKEVKEREPYDQTTPPDEKNNTIINRKYGGLIDLTKETLFFDQTGELMNNARELGEEGARFREELIMNAVTNVNGDALSGGDLYTVGNNNLLTSNSLGTAGWENAHTSLIDKKDNVTSKPIWVFGEKPIMLVPAGLFPTAWKLENNEYGPQGSANLDRNMAKSMFDIVVNPYLTKSTTDWWYGGFNRQFRWEEVWPLETFTRVGQDTTEGFKQDIVQQFKVSLYGGAGAVDDKYVIENNA